MCVSAVLSAPGQQPLRSSALALKLTAQARAYELDRGKDLQIIAVSLLLQIDYQ